MGARLSLLGGFELQCSEGAALVVLPKKARALLAFLAVSRGRAQSRERLAGLLWAESSEAHARMSLRKTLSAIRRALPQAGAGLIVADVEFVRLATDTLGSDVHEFEVLVADGSPTALEAALHLYKGELLEGFAASEPEFELWRAAERERLHRLAVDRAIALLGHFERLGALERAIETAAHAISLDPLREELHRTLMRLQVRLGHPELALKQYRVCRALLEKDLGVPTEPETDRLLREIQEQRRRPAADVTADGAPVRKLRTGTVAAVAGNMQSPGGAPHPAQHIELRWLPSSFRMLKLADVADEADGEMAHRSPGRCRGRSVASLANMAERW
jgi:DNA-binding SARP family transcriptional activator